MHTPEPSIYEPLSPDELNALVDSIATSVVERRLTTVAVLLLEMHKPISFIAGQAAWVAMPLLAPLVGARAIAKMGNFMSSRANIDLLISRIEEKAGERDRAAF